jgi:uncharacterized protein YndB with AHSA1/START domain
MLIVEESVLIHRPPHEVWAQLTNPANFTRWMRNAIDYAADWEQEPQVGDTYRIVEKVAWRRIKATAQVTGVVPGGRFTSKSTQAPFPVENTFRVEAVGDDTRLIYHGETPGPGGVLGKLSGPLLAKVFGRNMRSNLERLKTLIENR